MKAKNVLKAKIIFGIYLIATCALLLLGYSVQKPKVEQQEFPFSVTYTYQGKTETFSEIYVVEYVRTEKYLGDDSIAWFGYIKDHNRLELDFFRIAEPEGKSYAVNLHLEPGYLMGDPAYADAVCEPEAVCHIAQDMDSIEVSDPVELEQLGLTLDSWQCPTPIENSFSFGGISLSSQAAAITTAIAVVALLACMIAIKKDPELTYGKLDKASVVVNFLMAIVALPFILICAMLSEIVSDASFWQQLLYLAPALTAISIAASVALRKLGRKQLGFWIQFIAPAMFGLLILLTSI